MPERANEFKTALDRELGSIMPHHHHCGQDPDLFYCNIFPFLTVPLLMPASENRTSCSNIFDIKFEPVGVNQGNSPPPLTPPGDIWERLETFGVVTTEGMLLASSRERPGVLLRSILVHRTAPYNEEL